MIQTKSFIFAMFFGGMMLSGCEDSDYSPIENTKDDNTNIQIIDGVVHIKDWNTIDSLNSYLNEDEKLDFFSIKSPSFKSANHYYNSALDDLYTNDNTPEFVNSIKNKYPECIILEMLPDSSADLSYTSGAYQLSWILNKNNQIVVDSIIYTFATSKQTIEFLQVPENKPIITAENANVAWVSDSKVEITRTTLKSILKPSGTLVRGHKWDGKHRLQAALTVHHNWIGNHITYDKAKNLWNVRQSREIRVHFKQDRKMWYGWTKKPTNFTYSLQNLKINNIGGVWSDGAIPSTTKMYGREGNLLVTSKKRTHTSYFNPNSRDLPKSTYNLVFSISVDVKSGQVPSWFNLSYSNYNTYEY